MSLNKTRNYLVLLGLLSSAACIGAVESEAEFEGGPDGDFVDPESTREALYVKLSAKWPTRDVPVCWEPEAIRASSAEHRAIVKQAVADTWSRYSPIRFTGWETCNSYDYDPNSKVWAPHPSNSPGIHIAVRDVRPYVDKLGSALNLWPSAMVLNFTFATWENANCGGSGKERCIATIAAHEFGHALGFPHEQDRPDNNGLCLKTVDINERGSDYQTFGGYDIYSVMNYCNPTWSNGGTLSFGDISGVRQAYGQGYATEAELRANCGDTQDGSNFSSYKTCLADYKLTYVKDDATWTTKAKAHCYSSQPGSNQGAESYNGYKTCLAERDVTFTPDGDWCKKVRDNCGNNAQCLSDRSCLAATFYQHGSYGGYGVSLVQGSYSMSDLGARGIINDDISSIKVPPGVRVTIYQHDGYAGWGASYTRDMSWLEQYNDQLSSVVISADNPVFKDANGYTCAAWVGYDCTQQGWYYRYTADQLASVRANCPVSCSQLGR